MKRILILFSFVLLATSFALAQRTGVSRKTKAPTPTGSAAVVIDERLSVVREEPSLYSAPVKRFTTGTRITVYEEQTGEGVLFYKVSDTTAVAGWIQAEAIAGKFRKNDDQRIAQLIFGSKGFIQVHRSLIFLDLFQESPFRPQILLSLGDAIEFEAAEISKRAEAELVRREMAASGAPLHSFYLNYSELDRYRELGIKFLFNSDTTTLHYNGDSWFEITRKFPESPASIEARERIRTLTDKLKATE